MPRYYPEPVQVIGCYNPLRKKLVASVYKKHHKNAPREQLIRKHPVDLAYHLKTIARNRDAKNPTLSLKDRNHWPRRVIYHLETPYPTADPAHVPHGLQALLRRQLEATIRLCNEIRRCHSLIFHGRPARARWYSEQYGGYRDLARECERITGDEFRYFPGYSTATQLGELPDRNSVRVKAFEPNDSHSTILALRQLPLPVLMELSLHEKGTLAGQDNVFLLVDLTRHYKKNKNLAKYKHKPENELNTVLNIETHRALIAAQLFDRKTVKYRDECLRVTHAGGLTRNADKAQLFGNLYRRGVLQNAWHSDMRDSFSNQRDLSTEKRQQRNTKNINRIQRNENNHAIESMNAARHPKADKLIGQVNDTLRATCEHYPDKLIKRVIKNHRAPKKQKA